MGAGVRFLLRLGVLALIFGCLPLWTVQNATLTGTVRDQNGNSVAGAVVTLSNESTGFLRKQITDSSGSYTFLNVPPAPNYKISVDSAGFAPENRPSVTVQVGDARLVHPPFYLRPLTAEAPRPAPAPAAPPPTVAKKEPTPAPPPAVKPSEPTPTPAPRPREVAKAPAPPSPQPAAPPAAAPRPVAGPVITVSEAPQVPLEVLNTTLGGVIDSQAVRTLPLVGRDFIDLTLLVPGTYPVEQGSVLEGASMVVNGTRANMNNFLLDGVDNNDYTINQSLPFQIVEAMQEFRVQTSASSAEFGRSGGAQINTISRMGLNELHGTLFWFHRNSALSANNFFSAYNGGTFDRYIRERRLLGESDPLSNPTLQQLYERRDPHVVQNQFGATVGGALVKNKLFGFFNWESFRVANPRPIFERVPGNFLRGPNALFRTFFNRDPRPASSAIYRLYPAPNVPTVRGITDPDFAAFFVGESENRTFTDNFLGRIDWHIGERDSMSFKHNIQGIDQIQGGTLPKTASYPGNGAEVGGRNQNFSYNYAHQFGPRTNNEFRFGWIRFRLDALALDRTLDPGTLGFRELDFRDRGMPTLTIGGDSAVKFLVNRQVLADEVVPFASLGADSSVPSSRVNNVWSFADNFGLLRGRHNAKFGFEFRRVRLNATNEALGRGLLTFFDDIFVAQTDLPDVASIARVKPEFGGGFDRAFITYAYNWFAQDQWRLRSNLTLNYGLRYEVNTAPVETRDRLVNYFPALGGLVRAGGTEIFDPVTLVSQVKAPQAVPRGGFETDKRNWGPRLGLSWDPWNNSKTVIRFGYGLSFDQQPMEPSVNMLLNPPFVMHDFARFIFTDPPLPRSDLLRLENVFGRPTPTNEWFRLPYSITGRDPKARNTHVHQFHGGFQQQLGQKAQFELGYVGSLGIKLPRMRDLSACSPERFFRSPFTPPCVDPRTFDVATPILNQENTASSDFHSLQVRFQTQNFYGLQLRLHYMWAKSIDDASSLLPQVFVAPPVVASILSAPSRLTPQVAFQINASNFSGANNISPSLSLRPTLPVMTTRPRLPQDSANLNGERGVSDFDSRHRLVTSFIYDVPKWAPKIGSNWRIAGIFTTQSGQPYTVFADYFGIPLRPNARRTPTTDNDNPLAAIDAGILPERSTSAFDFQAGPGSLGRNTLKGPGLVNVDFSVLKEMHLGTERATLQFRAEFFNLLNITNFRQPVSQTGLYNPDFDLANRRLSAIYLVRNPFFGQILQARPKREVQFAVKLVF